MAISEATFTSIVPSICFDQIQRQKEFNMFRKKLKLSKIQIGSAPVVESDVKQFMNMYKIPLYQGYGQTETALRVTGVPIDLEKKLYEKLICYIEDYIDREAVRHTDFKKGKNFEKVASQLGI